MMQHVRQQQRERFITDELARAPHGVAEAKRCLLAGEAGLAGGWLIAGEFGQLSLLIAARAKGCLQLELNVEMVLDDTLVAARHKNEVFDASSAGLVDHVLDHRAVDHSQHFLRHRFGGGQEAGAEAGDGKHRFADALLGGLG